MSGDSKNSKNIPKFGIFFQCLKKLQFCRRLASYLEICLITEYRILKKIHQPVFSARPPDVLGTKFDEIPQNIMLSVEVCKRTSKAVYIMKFHGELA